MDFKKTFSTLINKIGKGSSKKIIQNGKVVFEQIQEMISKGLLNSCFEQLKEFISICEEINESENKEFNWTYAKACCLYQFALTHFGKRVDEKLFDKTEKVAENNKFFDIIFWLNQAKLFYAAITGRTADVEKAHENILHDLAQIDESSNLKIYTYPSLILNALTHGEPNLANEKALNFYEQCEQHGNVNDKVYALYLLGKTLRSLNKFEESRKYFEKAVSLGRENKIEQLIPALYNFGYFLLEEGNIKEAKKCVSEANAAIDDYFEIKDTYYNINLFRLSALLDIKDEKFETAEKKLKESIDIANKTSNILEEGLSYLELGQLCLNINKFNDASMALEEASAKFIMINDNENLTLVNKIRETIKKNESDIGKTIDNTQIQSLPIKNINALNEFLKLVVSDLNLEAVLNNVIAHIMKMTDADRGFLILLDEKRKLFSQVFRARDGSDKADDQQFRSFSHTITQNVLESKKTIWFADAQSDNNLAKAKSVFSLDIRSVICVPLKKDKFDIIGLIYIDRQALVDAFKEEDVDFVETLAEYASIALINAREHSGMKTKLKTAEEELIQSEKMATLGILAGGVAHEINTPLGAILINAQMIQRESPTASQLHMLEKIVDCTQRCKEIINLLLQYSRKSSAKLQELDLNQVIDSSYSFLEHQLTRDGIVFVIEKGDILPIKGNYNELMHVFTNLIINAKDAIKAIKSDGTIRIKSFMENKEVITQVIDDGEGINEENIGKIFDPFFTTKEVGKGTGLGLSIVYKIIENHKYVIEVDSEPQKGTIFTIRIPINK